MRRESKRIYNRNYDNPLRHVSLALKHSLCNTAGPTLRHYRHSHTSLACHWHLLPVQSSHLHLPTTSEIPVSATRQVGVAVTKKNVLSGFFHSTGSDPFDGLTSSLGPCPRDSSMPLSGLSPAYGLYAEATSAA